MKYPSFFCLAILIFCLSVIGYSQNDDAADEFVFAIVEFSKKENGQGYQIEVLSAKSIQKKLKTPTRSAKFKDNNFSGFRFQVMDQNQNILDEITMNDPLTVDYEYVTEDGKLAHKTVQETKKVVLIRRKINADAAYLSIRPRFSTRSNDFVITEIDRL